MLTYLPSARRADLLTRLCLQRQMTSLMERQIAVVATEFEENRENWVHMWIDPFQKVRGECGLVTAQRGITRAGQLLWLVRHRDKTHGYHAMPDDPVEAIAQARHAWAERRRVLQRWSEVEALARAARSGRYRQTVMIEDAYASALCEVGVRAFMTRIGLGRFTRPGVGRMSARNVARLMWIEPQVGFVLMAAFERRHGQRPVSSILSLSAARPARRLGFGAS